MRAWFQDILAETTSRKLQSVAEEQPVQVHCGRRQMSEQHTVASAGPGPVLATFAGAAGGGANTYTGNYERQWEHRLAA